MVILCYEESGNWLSVNKLCFLFRTFKMSHLVPESKKYLYYESDEDGYTEDDEVFLQVRADSEETCVNKPLMPPRRKARKAHTEIYRGRSWSRCLSPFIYCCVIVLALTAILCLVVFLVNTFLKDHFKVIISKSDQIISCSHLEVEDVWTVTLPKLLTESAIRLVDANQDGVLDILMGFATGADGYNVPGIVCDLYFSGVSPCMGGLLALDGKTGNELWRHYTLHEVFSVNCNADLNIDGVMDCLIGGRMAILQAVSGIDGRLLWNFGPQEARNEIMNVYTSQFIHDVDGDGIVDVLAVHGGDPLAEPGSKFRLSSIILIVSGQDGHVLQWVGVPDNKESYYSPQVYYNIFGMQMVLFGTGGETHGGSLWTLPLSDLLKGNMKKAEVIYSDEFKGVMAPPVLVDLTGDGVEDIVVALFNSSVIAINGASYQQIWKFSIPSSETYSTPSPGFYNEDTIADFLIKYAVGPGFPIYYYSKTTILDGRNGQPLINPYLEDSVGAQASGLTISVEGRGNDMFLYWIADCLDHEGKEKEFDFIKGTNVHEQSRANFCKLRFKSQGFSRLYLLSHLTGSPGFILYDSEQRKSLEYNNVVNTSALAYKYVLQHPELIPTYEHFMLKSIKEKRNTGTQKRIQKKRHVGPHDEDGIQRLLSTGSLAPVLNSSAPDANHSIDVIFATYWFFPAKTQAILPEDRDCIEDKMAKEVERFKPSSKYYGMDRDAYEHTITQECLSKSGHLPDEDSIYETQSDYNPFNIHMGQMTIYRLHVRCTCKNDPRVTIAGKKCSKILPFEKQMWSGYMGSHADAHFRM